MKTIIIKYRDRVPDNFTGIVEYPGGNKYWFLNGTWHREDGPAVEWSNGTKEWFLNGTLHRENGPAVEWINGNKSWYLDNVYYKEDEYRIEMILRNCTLGKLLMKRTQL